MSKNINLKNGNEAAWKTAEELTDAEVTLCLVEIKQINKKAGTELDAGGKISEAAYEAESAESDREYVKRWVAVYGELVIG